MPQLPAGPSNNLCVELDPGVGSTILIRDGLLAALVADPDIRKAELIPGKNFQVGDPLVLTVIKIFHEIGSSKATARANARDIVQDTPGADLCMPEPCSTPVEVTDLNPSGPDGIVMSDVLWGFDSEPDGIQWQSSDSGAGKWRAGVTVIGAVTTLGSWFGERQNYSADGLTAPDSTEPAIGYLDGAVDLVSGPVKFQLGGAGEGLVGDGAGLNCFCRTGSPSAALSAHAQVVIPAGTTITLNLPGGHSRLFTFAQNLEWRCQVDDGNQPPGQVHVELYGDDEGNLYFRHASMDWYGTDSRFELKSGSRVLVAGQQIGGVVQYLDTGDNFQRKTYDEACQHDPA